MECNAEYREPVPARRVGMTTIRSMQAFSRGGAEAL